MQEGDKRLLLITDNYPDFVPDDLDSIWESIRIKSEDISGDHTLSDYLLDIEETTSEQNRLTKLIAIYLLMQMSDDIALQELKELDIDIKDFSFNSLMKLKSIIDIEKTNLEIYILRTYNDDKPKKEFNYLFLLQDLSNVFGRSIQRDISTTEFFHLLNSAKKLNNKYNKNGRVTDV